MTKKHRQSPAALLEVGQGPGHREALGPWAPGRRAASCRHAGSLPGASRSTPALERGAAAPCAGHAVTELGNETRQ